MAASAMNHCSNGRAPSVGASQRPARTMQFLVRGVLAAAGVLGGFSCMAEGAGTAPVPRPFVALAAGHVGAPYTDQVADGFDVPVSSYHIVAGALPGGLILDGATGKVVGTPAQAR